jgi:putative transposase
MAEAGPGIRSTKLARKRSPASKFEIPDGWVARGFEFEVEWPNDAEEASKIRSHFGARRTAYNWALSQVKADMDTRKADPCHLAVPWNLYALRKQWNAEKAVVAPWWAENSKEAYATGIADLCTALKNWSNSMAGRRKGRSAGFPKFRSRRTDPARVRFTTGAIRAEADRRTITLPVIGSLRSRRTPGGWSG